MVRVKLLSFTPNPEKIIALAARQTRLAVDVTEIDLDEKRIAGLINRLIVMKHLSPFEHASFTFLVSNVSRVCTHQIVRHRLASYSQQSQRMVKISGSSFVIPPSIKGNEEALKLFKSLIEKATEVYNKLIEKGIPLEDARFIIPQAVETKIVITMNARELLHFFNLRLCRKSQWEIREVAEKMLETVRKVSPNIFKHAGPICWDYGYCPEGDEECFKEVIKKRPS